MPISLQPPEGVHLLELKGYEDVYKLWDKFRSIPALFDDFTRGNMDRFIQLLMSPNSMWLELDDGNGILYLTDIMPGLSAYAHFVFWDRKLRGREVLINQVMRWAVVTLNLLKLNAWIPDFAKAAIHFAEKLGFKKEGELRRWSVSNGRVYDKIALGMTREEVLNGTGLLFPERERAAGELVSTGDEGLDGPVPVGDGSVYEAAGVSGSDVPAEHDGHTADVPAGEAVPS